MRNLIDRTARRLTLACAGTLLAFLPSEPAMAVTPESPEVRRLIDKGIKFLETQTHRELGGKCLIGLAFIKDDQPDHPKVKEALEACREERSNGAAGGVYSNGIALIFLCELDAKGHRDLIDFFLGALQRRQKDNGGWGYDAKSSGDTSQTQYGTLGLWEAHQHRVSIGAEGVSRCLDWVIKTQDPSGAWGYQGKVAGSGGLVAQSQIRPSMVTAGLSSLLVCADLFGLLTPGASDELDPDSATPEGFREAKKPDAKGRPKPLGSRGIDQEQLFTTFRSGQAWFDKNFTVQVAEWNYYYLYSVERYKSFEELLLADVDEEPAWYNQGYEFLAEKQTSEGAWGNRKSRVATSTAFAVLFLLRSTQKTLQRGLGEGVTISGRGAPVALARKKGINPGGVLIKKAKAEVSDLLALLDEGKAAELDSLASDPTAFAGGAVDEKTARRLQQLARGGEPAARLLAVRALGRSGKLDYAPTLLYALTDPDRRVTLEARDGLRLMSRRFEGYGLPDNYTDRQRYEAIDKWKNWYLTFRPNAILDLPN